MADYGSTPNPEKEQQPMVPTGQPMMQQPMQQQPMTQPIIVQQQPTQQYHVQRVVQPTFHMYSHNLMCWNCNTEQPTKVQAENGSYAWMLCLGLACIGCWLGCCLIPFYVDSCKDYYHRCANCDQLLAIKKTC